MDFPIGIRNRQGKNNGRSLRDDKRALAFAAGLKPRPFKTAPYE